MEKWLPIKGYKGLYFISSYGRLKNKHNRLLKFKKHDGYFRVGLSKNNKQTLYYVHRLVLDNFKPIINKAMTVDHIDGNRSNNRLNNLRWLSIQDNVKFAQNRKRRIKFVSDTEIHVFCPKINTMLIYRLV